MTRSTHWFVTRRPHCLLFCRISCSLTPHVFFCFLVGNFVWSKSEDDFRFYASWIVVMRLYSCCNRRTKYLQMLMMIIMMMIDVRVRNLFGKETSLGCRAPRASCCTQRWTLTVINWRRLSMELSWQHLQRSTYCGESPEFGEKF